MKALLRYALLAGLLVSCGTSAAMAGTVKGTVKNGTTGQLGAGVEVVLIQLAGGMQPVANTKTDASGQFTFDNPNIGAQPMLVRAIYHGVNFHQPLPPGKDSVTVDIYDASTDPKTINVPSHIVIFQPNGSSLIVGEEYAVQNSSKPPVAFFRADGNFTVSVPANAELKQIAAAGPAGMPVVQAPIDKGKNNYSIAFAFKPGESDIRLSYEVPYASNSASVKLTANYAGRLLLVAPPGVSLSGEGLQSAGQQQGMDVYSGPVLNAGDSVTVAISGTAPPPNSASQANGRGEAAPEDAAGTIQVIPGRLDSLKWYLVGGFLVLFALAGVLLARKPVAVTVKVPQDAPDTAVVAQSPSSKGTASSIASASLESLDKDAATSLDGLKDLIFRLELRRQAGTISEDEYSKERAKAEQILRDLVRG